MADPVKAWGECGMCGGSGKIGVLDVDADRADCPTCGHHDTHFVPCPTCAAHWRGVEEAIKQRDAAWTRALTLAANDVCECGGKGPDDADRCDACRIYHATTKEVHHGK